MGNELKSSSLRSLNGAREGALEGYSRNSLLDTVWALASDRQWHTVEEVTARLPFDASEVSMVFDFLLKYGFAESTGTGEKKRVRLFDFAPSPREVAMILRHVKRRSMQGRWSSYSTLGCS